jgi:hypothetical protein
MTRLLVIGSARNQVRLELPNRELVMTSLQHQYRTF